MTHRADKLLTWLKDHVAEGVVLALVLGGMAWANNVSNALAVMTYQLQDISKRIDDREPRLHTIEEEAGDLTDRVQRLEDTQFTETEQVKAHSEHEDLRTRLRLLELRTYGN